MLLFGYRHDTSGRSRANVVQIVRTLAVRCERRVNAWARIQAKFRDVGVDTPACSQFSG